MPRVLKWMIIFKNLEIESSVISDGLKELYLSILDAVHYMPPWGMGVRRKTHWSAATLRPTVAGTLSILYLCVKVYVCMYTHILSLNVVMPSKLAKMAKHPSIYTAMSALRGSAGEARVSHSLAFSKGSCSLSSCSNPLPPGGPHDFLPWA